MRIAVLLSVLMLAACQKVYTAADGTTTTVAPKAPTCAHGVLYYENYVYGGKIWLPFIGRDGKPVSCEVAR
jgi:hypothetical protein